MWHDIASSCNFWTWSVVKDVREGIVWRKGVAVKEKYVVLKSRWRASDNVAKKTETQTQQLLLQPLRRPEWSLTPGMPLEGVSKLDMVTHTCHTGRRQREEDHKFKARLFYIDFQASQEYRARLTSKTKWNKLSRSKYFICTYENIIMTPITLYN